MHRIPRTTPVQRQKTSSRTLIRRGGEPSRFPAQAPTMSQGFFGRGAGTGGVLTPRLTCRPVSGLVGGHSQRGAWKAGLGWARIATVSEVRKTRGATRYREMQVWRFGKSVLFSRVEFTATRRAFAFIYRGKMPASSRRIDASYCGLH